MNDLFLELTHFRTENVLKDDIHGEAVFLDPTKIVTLSELVDEKEEVYTSIFLDGPIVVDVKETPQEIADKIMEQLMPRPEFEGEVE